MITRFDVCVVGSANLDVVTITDRHPRPGETVLGSDYREYAGGKGLNQAVAAARSGSRVAFVAAVGDDAAGRQLLAVLADDGIDASGVATATLPTGRAVIVVDRLGENTIVVVAGANGTVAAPRSLPDAAAMLCQLEIPLDAVAATFRIARDRGSVTVLNPAPAIELPPEVIACCDVIVPNQHEVELLGGAPALLAAGCGAVVVTLGGDGVEIHTTDESVHLPAFAVSVVDTTGAGDAFCGALTSRLAAGDDLTVAARWATAAGALATTTAGAVPAQPTAGAIRELLDSSGQ